LSFRFSRYLRNKLIMNRNLLKCLWRQKREKKRRKLSRSLILNRIIEKKRNRLGLHRKKVDHLMIGGRLKE